MPLMLWTNKSRVGDEDEKVFCRVQRQAEGQRTSSSSSSAGFLQMDLAMAMRCFCPPDRLIPPASPSCTHQGSYSEAAAVAGRTWALTQLQSHVGQALCTQLRHSKGDALGCQSRQARSR